MRAIKFSDDALWHVGPDAVPLDQFVWPELTIAGGTSTAKAIRKLTDELSMEKMSKKGYPPVCILVSDGYCTDPSEEYNSAIQELEQQPWGKKAVRFSIAIGNESNYDASARAAQARPHRRRRQTLPAALQRSPTPATPY